MIAEDEPLERMALRKIINRDLCHIDILEDAKDGTEAVEMARLYRPDIILMDIRMPEMTGIEAQKKIIKFLPNVKTIIVTAYGDFSFAQEAIKYGVIDYLLKPARPDDIKKAIEKAIALIRKDSLAETDNLNDEHSEQHILTQAVRYIDKHYQEELRLGSVAEFVHLNPQYLSRLFKKELGTTFTEYLTGLRINKAKRLLLETTMPIYRIAVELGFSDAAYFSKVFLKSEGQSPFEFRKNHKLINTGI